MEKFNIESAKGVVNHPFTVPGGYFDNFTESLMAQLPEKEYRPAAKKISLRKKITPWIYAAAMVASVALIFQFVMPTSRQGHFSDVINLDHTSIKQALSNISEDDFFEIIDERAHSHSYHQTLLSDSNY